jgi:flagellar biosynthesis protein FlhG
MGHFGRSPKTGEMDSNSNGNFQSQRPRIITVSSGKGGVGKTNIVVNIALALGLLERKVMVMDSDLGLGDINILLGKSPPCSLNNLLDGDKLLGEILYEGPGGISILPASSDSSQDVNLDESQKAVFLNEIDLIGDMKDLLLIDTGAGISSNVLFFNLIANDSIVITTPEVTSIANASSLIRAIGLKNPKKHFLILINLVQNGREAKEIFKRLCKAIDQFSTILSIGYLGYVPYDKYLPLAVKDHRLVLDCFPESISSQQFREIAKVLINDSKHRQVWGKMRTICGSFSPAAGDGGRG